MHLRPGLSSCLLPLCFAAAAGCASPGIKGYLPVDGGGLPGNHDLAATAPTDLATIKDLEHACSPACAAPTPVCDPATGHCLPCLPGADPKSDVCPQGSYCGSGDGGTTPACIPGCKADADCTSDGGGQAACCNHECVDVSADSANCGRCGAACVNQACCSGHCTDTTSNLDNCGACGKPCAKGANAMIACTNSACAILGCDPGFADCNMNPADGCEAALASDPNNCGMCGAYCNIPNGTGGCMGGVCTVASCFAGFADCNMMVADGCEAAITTDPRNCGGCGKACPVEANASVSCSGGMCSLAKCNPGFADCNGNPNDGCEVNVNSDPLNCGMCLNVCGALPNAMVGCAMGMCAITGCSGNFRDCNMLPADGCEADITKDLNNCGACGMKCPAVANGAPGCNGGACGIASCNANFGDCDKNPANGCETNLLTNNANCGACGNACPNGQTCVNGACLAGCLKGKNPPAACQAGTDAETGSPWVICQADCNSAWVSMTGGGGTYHALQICQRFGYSSVGQYGGTCGNVCGYCQGATSCNGNGSRRFDGGGNGGSDQFGLILHVTVMWTCLK